MIQRQPPRGPHQPGPERFPIAQLAKAAVGAHERFLRHVFRILLLAQYRKGDAKGESRAVGDASLELTLELIIHGHEWCREVFRARSRHLSPTTQDSTARSGVH